MEDGEFGNATHKDFDDEITPNFSLWVGCPTTKKTIGVGGVTQKSQVLENWKIWVRGSTSIVFVVGGQPNHKDFDDEITPNFSLWVALRRPKSVWVRSKPTPIFPTHADSSLRQGANQRRFSPPTPILHYAREQTNDDFSLRRFVTVADQAVFAESGAQLWRVLY